MATPPKSTAGSNKRDFEEYQEQKQIGESEESVKKPRLEVTSESAHTFDDLFEDPPENWTEDEAVKMWGDLLNDPEPEGGAKFGGKEQQKFGERYGQGPALTAASSHVEHKSVVIEQDMPTLSQSTAPEKTNEADALKEGESTVMGAISSTQNTSTLSNPQPVQHSSSSVEKTLKPRFPPADTPLPEGISLDKLCRRWPHHLAGRTLRRFIEEGCNAGWIFVRLDYFIRRALDKQGALEKKKGWEVVQQRLDEEKARMAEEAKQAGLQAQNNMPAGSSNRPDTTSESAPEAIAPQNQGQGQQFRVFQTPQTSVDSLQSTSRTTLAQPLTSPQLPALSADIPITNVRHTPASSREGGFSESQRQPPSAGTRDTRHLLPTSHIDRVNNHTREIQHELTKHQNILRDISFADSSWAHKTPEERVQDERKHWMDQARSYEEHVVDLLGGDVVGIDFQSTRPRDVLARQLELIRRVLTKRAPHPDNASVQDIRINNEKIEATSLRQQRDVLVRWTETLQEMLAGIRNAFSQSIETIEASSGTPRSQAAQSQAHGTHSLSPPHRSQSFGTEVLSNLPARAQEGQVLGHQRPESRPPSSPLDRDSTRMHYPIDLPPPNEPAAPTSRPEGGSVTARTDQSGQRPYYYSSIDGQYHAYPVFSVPQPQIGYQGIIPPTKASSAVTPVAGPPTSTDTPKRKRRGAPRTVMFPNVPRSNTPLSALAKVDNEEVLRSFPEHLSIPEVMRRFVRPNGAKTGGWQTRKMVNYLLGHENKKDYTGISENERRANLSRWVTKERDSCNNKIRKELGISKKTTKSTIVQNQPSSTSSSILPNTQQITSLPPLAHSAPPYPQSGYSQLPQPHGGFPQPHGGFPQPHGGFPQPHGGYPAPSYVQSAFFTAPYSQDQHLTLQVTGAPPAGYDRIMTDAPSGLQTLETPQVRVPHVPRNQGGLSDALSPTSSRLQESLLNTALGANEWCDLEEAEGDWEPQV
ncbi:hypothetical protein EPUS_08742 [Endocarpon pusillum Z07020]|uniref:Uncharacterized protein n=1 Tax=Endocarpon pusillum (strain Z07020 / HMAS-L-300199) TaxID=1263415 RepID=U1GL56_ENDPU|nr:uncharacterized protein EPUS_08742 [Endocarpon pusillum Z07020]ERF72606.1 hypothetical protein EPUS_08742 [Endocarpon pusillum Z07020]